MVTHAAFGGSLNLLLHIPAIAHAAGLPRPTVDDWIAVNRRTAIYIDLVKQPIDPASGYQAFDGRKIAYALGLSGKQVNKFVAMMGALYKAFTELDCSLIEINPLVVTGAGEVIALDAKMNFDDNALERHQDLEQLRDLDEEDPSETEAAKYALNYVKLDGQIGCMVNGAGLAMATMDIIKLYGCLAGELPRCRRRRHQGARDGGVQDHPQGPQRRRHPGQHLRRHHALRRDRRGRGRRGARGQPARAAGGAARRHQRRARQEDPEGVRPARSRRPKTSPTPPRRSSRR